MKTKFDFFVCILKTIKLLTFVNLFSPLRNFHWKLVFHFPANMTPVHAVTLVYSTESLALKVVLGLESKWKKLGSLRYHNGDGHENVA